jgi:hypothetical protein
VSVAGTVLFLWLLVSLARWGRARLPDSQDLYLSSAFNPPEGEAGA